MQEIRVFDRYIDFKQEFDREYRSQTEGYIKMGYLLKVARDTDILRGSGYKSIAEFAWNEYKIRDDAVSRMIDVNDRFSEGGYSDKLDGKYQGYGASLLAEMITMSDAVIDALPPGTTREVIREVKKEIREEEKVSDLEVLIEGQDSRQQGMESNLAKALHQYYRENMRSYPEMYKAVKAGGDLEDTALRVLAPSGVGVKTVRIQGIGKIMLSIKGRNQSLELVNIRTNETELYTWEDCAEIMLKMCTGKNYRAAFEALYGEEYPEPEKEKDDKREEIRAAEDKENKKGTEKPRTEPEKTYEEANGKDKELGDDIGIGGKAEAPVNTGKEQDNENVGNGNDQANDNGEEKGSNQEEPEQDIAQQDAEKQELAPAQPEQGEQNKGDEIEVIENPYREYLDDANLCLVKIRELLDDEDFKKAYIVGQNLVSALNEMRKIEEGRDEQIAGQMELENYTG